MEEAATEEPIAPENDDDPLETLLRDYEEWLTTQPERAPLGLNYNEEEDVFELTIDPDMPVVVAYANEIDEDFYGEDTAIFVEYQLGSLDPTQDLAKLLLFCGEQMVLSRLSLREEENDKVLVVEAAIPYGQVDFEYFDLIVQEVAAIGADLKEFQAGGGS